MLNGVNDYVDAYCERVAPGFWGEPLNAVSNLAFLIAAVATWLLARRAARATGRPAASVHALAVLLALIFLSSSAFHTAATRWGAALDSGFIAVFLLSYIVLFTRLFWTAPWRLAWLAAPAFLLFTALVAVTVGQLFRGPGMYLSALLGLLVLAAALHRSKHADRRPHWRPFALAAAVFTVSLTFRTMDHTVCSGLPTGTHFLWHILNACTLFIVSRAAITRWQETPASLTDPLCTRRPTW
jgi:hypothetical protein